MTCPIASAETNGQYICTRYDGHTGPCAAVPAFDSDPAMSFEQWLLTKLAEECVEVAQRALKAQQFGFKEVQKDQPFNNAERLSGELADLNTTARLLIQLKLIGPFDDLNIDELKRQKLNKYLEYSRSLGMVAPGRLVPGRTE